MFISRREREGSSIGSRLQLTSDVTVLKGTFTRGTIVEVIGDPDERGEFLCRDTDSREEVYLHPCFGNYRKV